MSRSESSSREGKRNAKLELVLAVAGELFAASDFQHVCMDDIAVRAGVGKGTLYNLFRSKEDLYFSIIRKRLNELIGILEQVYDRRNDTLKNLRSLILHLHKFMSKHAHFYLIWKREENGIDQDDPRGIGTLQHRIYELVLRVLERGEKEGTIRRGQDRELIGRLLLGMIDGLRKIPGRVYSREDSIDSLLVILLKGIGTEGIDPRVTYHEYKHKVKRNDE